MSHKKKIIISAEEVNQLIIFEGEPPTYRLLNTQHEPVPNKVDYTETIKTYLDQVSNNKMVEYTNGEGWHILNKTTRLYLNCKPKSHNNGKHVLFYKNEDLKPDSSLLVQWIIKCKNCQANIPSDTELSENRQNSHVAVTDKIIPNPSGRPNINFTVNLEDISHNSEESQRDVIFNVFNRIADKLAATLQENFEKCENSENPIHALIGNQTELSVRLALAASEIIGALINKPSPEVVPPKEIVTESDNLDAMIGLSSRASNLLKKASAAKEAQQLNLALKLTDNDVNTAALDLPAEAIDGGKTVEDRKESPVASTSGGENPKKKVKLSSNIQNYFKVLQ